MDYPASINFGNLGFQIGQAMINLANAGRINNENENKNNTNQRIDISNMAFGALSRCVENQYDGLKEPITGVKLNKTHSLEQNIVDSGALNQAYRTFEKHLKQLNNSCSTPQLPSFIAQFTPEQLFFISYSSYFCSEYKNPTGLFSRYREDTHTPDKFRVNVPLSNMAQFSKAFNCPVGSPMNLEFKCDSLW